MYVYCTVRSNWLNVSPVLEMYVYCTVCSSWLIVGPDLTVDKNQAKQDGKIKMNFLMRIDVKAGLMDPQHVSFLDPDPKGAKYQQKIEKKV